MLGGCGRLLFLSSMFPRDACPVEMIAVVNSRDELVQKIRGNCSGQFQGRTGPENQG